MKRIKLIPRQLDFAVAAQTMKLQGFKSGVYALCFSSTNKMYIGSSRDIIKRFGEHLWSLRNNAHSSVRLQQEYNEEGESSICLVRLEACEEAALLDTEQLFMDCNKSLLLNSLKRIKARARIKLRLPGFARKNAYGHSANSPEGLAARSVMSAIVRTQWASGVKKGTPKSAETRAKMSIARREYWKRKNEAN